VVPAAAAVVAVAPGNSDHRSLQDAAPIAG